ncbi:unnamed protein product [Caenorhabditis angaria]|uniref:Fungal lipase-type domain-containing protein n=1 Tax=Caenorhabditis angaria TaxID=860376 RepID=A0A9P1IQM7_9PELO|nr:unnamed protein product [Caenorhabditis angaria]
MKTVLFVSSLIVLVSANPLVFQKSLVAFSDDVARNKLFPLAAAAYSSTPQTCMTKKFTNAQLRRQVNVNCDAGSKSDICSGYSAVLVNDQAIVLSFRGTQSFMQLIEEANESVFSSQTAWSAGGKVSKYFADAFNLIWTSGMKDDFTTLIHKYPNYEIWVTGHSLGGAMASLAASFIVSNKLVTASNVKLITYGQPRTGNTDFANAHDAQLPYSFRLTHNRDVVPHIPNEGFEGYHHHKTEVWYKESMSSGASYTVCADQQESNKCSNGLLITTSVDDHTHYFGKEVSAWGIAGCN